MEFLNKLKQKWQTVFIITLMTAGAVFSVSAFLPPQYGSEISILVIQKQPSDKVDAFSAAKSAEYLSDILAKVVYTESFVQNVNEAPFDAEINLPIGEKEKRQYWKKKVEVSKVNNTGIINIVVYDKNRENAEKIAESIAWAYYVRGARYHGGGERVEIKKIDGPVTPAYPTKPNILLNTLLGAVLGLMGSFAVVYFFDDFELRLFPRKSKDKDEDEDGGSGKSFHIPFNFMKNGKRDSLPLEDYVFEPEDEKKGEGEKTATEESVDENTPGNYEGNEVEISEPHSFQGQLSFSGQVQEKEESENKDVSDSIKKADSPGNLPVFEGGMDELFAGENGNGEEEVDGSQEKTEDIDNQAQENYDKESSENEVKDKLNKLLRGEM